MIKKIILITISIIFTLVLNSNEIQSPYFYVLKYNLKVNNSNTSIPPEPTPPIISGFYLITYSNININDGEGDLYLQAEVFYTDDDYITEQEIPESDIKTHTLFLQDSSTGNRVVTFLNNVVTTGKDININIENSSYLMWDSGYTNNCNYYIVLVVSYNGQEDILERDLCPS